MDVAEDALADALLKIESNEKLSDDESNLLQRVISDLGPEQEVNDTLNEGLALLAIKKKRLELLEKGY
jgi:hypothetical protein